MLPDRPIVLPAPAHDSGSGRYTKITTLQTFLKIDPPPPHACWIFLALDLSLTLIVPLDRHAADGADRWTLCLKPLKTAWDQKWDFPLVSHFRFSGREMYRFPKSVYPVNLQHWLPGECSVGSSRCAIARELAAGIAP